MKNLKKTVIEAEEKVSAIQRGKRTFILFVTAY